MADKVNLDSSTTAVVLIDLQHGIVGRELAPRSGVEAATTAAGLASAARAAGVPVVYLHVDLNEMLALPADKPRARPEKPLPAQAMEIVPEAGYRAETDLLVLKRQPGAFYGTELDQLLRRRGIRTIVLGGIATNIGVESTARAALDRGYAVVFVSDAMTSMTAEMHGFCIETMFPTLGRVRVASEIGFGA